ncbi:MAG TPA: PA14 domain-containing protein [Methylomirabilota bacterium]|nr:PA14 domain-containing protein [Methylomirabilota bacterium]
MQPVPRQPFVITPVKPCWLIFLLALFVSSNALALEFHLSADNFDAGQFGGKGGWASGRLALPEGASIGSTPLEVVIHLSTDLTMANTDGTGRQAYGFGIGGLVPGVLSGDVVCQVEIALRKNGINVTAPITHNQINSFPHTIDNLSSSSSRTFTSSTISFNQIRLRITSPVTRTVREISTGLQTAQKNTTPATTEYAVSADNYDAGQFGGKGGWASGRLNLPGGAAVGPTPMNLILKLSKDLTIRDYEGTGRQAVGFGIGDFNPKVQPSERALALQMKFYHNGTQVAGPVDYTINNNFPNAISGIGVGFSWPITSSSVTFNEVRIQLTAPVARAVTHFEISLQVPPPNVAFVSLSQPASILTEADTAGTGIMVQRQGPVTSPLTVNLTYSGSAVSGNNIAALPATVVIPAGEEASILSILPLNNELRDGTRNLIVKVAAGSGYLSAGAGQAELLINDDDFTGGTGAILWEVWRNINGTAVTDLTGNPKFASEPDETWVITNLEAPSDRADNFGSRFRGFIHPPVTGVYEFWVNSDDQSQLWLSSDDNPVNKALIAHEPQWNNSRDWLTTVRRNPLAPENRSAPLTLQAGKKYYVEVLHKEGGGGDNLSVAWKLPNGVFQGPIPGQFLSAWGFTPPAPILSALTPDTISSGAGIVKLVISGASFDADARIVLNGQPVLTTWINSEQLETTIDPAALSGGQLLRTLKVAVQSSGLASTEKVLTISDPSLATAAGTLASAGHPGSIALQNVGGSGVALSASLAHEGEGKAILAGALLGGALPNPAFYDEAASYYILHVGAVVGGDVGVARFYYPASISGQNEAALQLIYFNGSSWQPVYGAGLHTPLKVTEDNADGTTTGGYIEVALGDSSSPALPSVNQTLFAVANAAPRVAINSSITLTQVGAPVGITVSFAALGDPATQKIIVEDGLGNSSSLAGNQQGVLLVEQAYPKAGLYLAAAELVDAWGRRAHAALDPIIVVDPAGPGILGGGWFSFEGQKIHAVVQARYDDRNAVTGQLRIFSSGRNGLEFASSALEWFTATPGVVHLAGQGRLGSHTEPAAFLLTVTSAIEQRIRLQIWSRASGAKLFDNEPGAGMFELPSSSATLLEGGITGLQQRP